MSSFDDAIWAHLVDHHGADRFEFQLPSARRRTLRRSLVTAGAAVLAGAVAAVVLLLIVSSGTPPAYALTRVAPGSYTVSLNDIAAGIPALNAKFAKLGIRVTVVPVKAQCTESSFSPVQATPGSMRETVTISNRGIRPGYRGFIAAERLPDGRIGLAVGATPQPIPSCFPTAISHGIPGPSKP